jgi:hypothetical protein
MVVRYFIQEGLIVKKQNTNDKDYAGLFSLDKLFKKLLSRWNVAFSDKCCDQDSTVRPVRYNKISAHLEYLDVDNVWKTVPSL